MTIEQTISADYLAAMKERDARRVSTLRLVLSALKNEAIKSGAGTVLDDNQTLVVLNREVKQRGEAINEYNAAGRDERAQNEAAEIEIIKKYMPVEMDDAALTRLLDEVVQATGATTRSDMGRIMAALKSKLANPADVGRAARLASARLV